jgi:hypothetical protein
VYGNKMHVGALSDAHTKSRRQKSEKIKESVESELAERCKRTP